MAAKDLALKILINAEDKASSVFNSLKNNAGEIAAAITSYFSARFFQGAIEDAAAFEKQMATVSAVSGTTGEDLAKLEKAAKDMGATTQFTATQAAEALESLARAGLSASEQMDALPSVLALAQANGIELNQAASLITQTVAGMGLSFGDAANVADVLTKAAASANTSVEGLGSALSYAAPVAQSMGLTLQETTAFLAKLADAGIDASRAGTSLNNMMIQFQNPASAFKKELSALGIDTNDFGEALAQLEGKGNSGQAAILALGQEAGPALRALLNQGIGSVQELTKELENSSGAAASAANTMSSNLDGAVKSLGSSWEGLKLQLAQPILEPLSNALNYVTGQFQALVSDGSIARFGTLIADTFKTATDSAIAFVNELDFSALGSSLSAFGDAAGRVLGTLKGAFVSFVGLFSSGTNEANSFGSAFNTVMGAALDAATAFVSAFDTGLNAIKTGFFTVAGAGAKFVEGILSGVALIQEGIAKITFGDVSKRWAAEAEKSKTIAESFGQSAQENFGKAEQALEDTAKSAEKTGDALIRLGTSQDDLADKTTKTTKAVKELGTESGISADELDALGEGAQVVDGQLVGMATAADTAAKTVGTVGQAAQTTAGELKKASTSTAEVEAAFKALGVESSFALKRSAEEAKTAFETIKNSGLASATDIKNAFSAYAEKAIEANGGVASETLKVEAAMNGVKIATDAAGQSIVENMAKSKQSVSALVSEYDRLVAAQQQHIDMQLAEERAALRAAQARSDQIAANNQANIDNLARTVSRDFTAKEQGYIDQIKAKGGDIDAVLQNINATLNNAALGRGGSAWNMESLLRRAAGNTIAPTSSQKTINVNLNVGGKTATGSFPDTDQTRTFLRELENAQRVTQ